MAKQGFDLPPCYTDFETMAVGTFGWVLKAAVVPGSVREDNPFFARLETNRVAIKKIPLSTAFKDRYHSKQVYREITLLKQLSHDNLIKLVDLFTSPAGDVYLVTEAMECDLGVMINSNPDTFVLEESHTMWIMYQLIRGLKYLHSAAVLHRDLKPQNILVNSALSVRICDLGLARTGGQQDDGLPATATGYVTTRWYRAPEVMLTWQHYTNALDMWSAGCIFAEMLNRLSGNVTYVDGNGVSYYALFPSDSHDEHLGMILGKIGTPSPEIVANIATPSIQEFVATKSAEMATNGPVKHIGDQLKLTNSAAAHLVAGLLTWDPRCRLSAEAALEQPYVAAYRDPMSETVRSNPISTQFEDFDFGVEMWQQIVLGEIKSISTMQPLGSEGLLELDPLQDPSAGGGAPLPNLGAGHAMGATMGDTAEELLELPSPLDDAPMEFPLAEMPAGVDLAVPAADMPPLSFPDMMSLDHEGYSTQQASLALSQYETDTEYLRCLEQQGGLGESDRGSLLNAFGEVNSRLSTMRQLNGYDGSMDGGGV